MPEALSFSHNGFDPQVLVRTFSADRATQGGKMSLNFRRPSAARTGESSMALDLMSRGTLQAVEFLRGIGFQTVSLLPDLLSNSDRQDAYPTFRTPDPSSFIAAV